MYTRMSDDPSMSASILPYIVWPLDVLHIHRFHKTNSSLVAYVVPLHWRRSIGKTPRIGNDISWE